MQKMKIYTYQEVAKHNTKESCWVVINNRVYDMTEYLLEHPGGEDLLIENSGGDATVAFISISHSPDAQQLLKKFQIGTVDEIKPEIDMDGVKFNPLAEESSNMNSFTIAAAVGLGISLLVMYFLFND